MSTSLRSEHCPSGIYSPGTYSGSLPPQSRDIGNSVSRRLVDTSHRPPSITSPPVPVITHTEHGRPQVKRREIRTRTSSGYPVSGPSFTFGSGESFPQYPRLGRYWHRHADYPPRKFCSAQKCLPTHGITQLGLRSRPTGSSNLRPLQRHFHSLGLTNQFSPKCRSDPLVLATLLRQWQDLSFTTSQESLSSLSRLSS